MQAKKISETKIIDKSSESVSAKEIINDYIDNDLINSFIKPTREKTIKLTLWLMLGSLILAFAFKYFIIPAEILSAGVSGIAITITRITGDGNSFAIWNSLLNLPLFIFGLWKIGKRFSISSAIAIVMISVFSFILPSEESWHIIDAANAENRLVAVIAGQLLVGFGVSLFFMHGASSGGIDFVSTYLSIKKGVSIAFYAMVLNIAIVLVSLVIIETNKNGVSANTIKNIISTDLIYTFIGIIVNKMVIERAFPKFKKMKLNITTPKYKELSKLLKEINYPHAWTLVPIIGGYTGKDKTMITIICTYLEIKKTVELVRLLDSNAFIYTSKVPNIYGRFTIK